MAQVHHFNGPKRFVLPLLVIGAVLPLSAGSAYATICGKQSCLGDPPTREPRDPPDPVYRPSPQPSTPPQPSPEDIARQRSNGLIREGRDFYLKGNYSAALETYLSAINADKTNDLARSNFFGTRAVIDWRGGDFQSALDDIKLALKYNNDSQFWKGVGAQIARDWIAQIEARRPEIEKAERIYLVQLQMLESRFRQQTANFTAWADDTEREYDEAERKVVEIFFTSIVTAITTGTSEYYEGRIDELMERAKDYKDIRYAKKADIRQIIETLQYQFKIQGKSAVAAKRAILAELRANKVAITDTAAAVEAAADHVAHNSVPQTDPHPEATLRTKLEKHWPEMTAMLEVAYTTWPKWVGAVGKMAGLLALAPDALDVGAEFLAIHADGTNINALYRLQNSTEDQRKNITSGLNSLIQERRKLNQWEQTLQNWVSNGSENN
jgi:hypothetical protein